MVILITGDSHTGKTYLSQKLLEKYQYPYLSIDHLKMGLIRSGYTNLTPESSLKELTDYLWPVTLNIIKTAIENKQNLIVEGCYIPFNYKEYFNEEYLEEINFICLIFTEKYINNHFNDIVKYESVIEKRICRDYSLNEALESNKYFLEMCKKEDLNYILIDDVYDIDNIM